MLGSSQFIKYGGGPSGYLKTQGNHHVHGANMETIEVLEGHGTSIETNISTGQCSKSAQCPYTTVALPTYPLTLKMACQSNRTDIYPVMMKMMTVSAYLLYS